MTRVAIIGDVGGHHAQLVDCLARLGVTATTWPAGLEVIQVGDLFGGVNDVDVARLVEPHLYAGRWRQLIGNWELEAVGGPEVTDTKGRGADRAALEYFARWRDKGGINVIKKAIQFLEKFIEVDEGKNNGNV